MIELFVDKLANSDSLSPNSNIELINGRYQRTIERFPRKDRSERIKALNVTFDHLKSKLSTREESQFTETQQAILRLKLARHFEFSDECDASTLLDAIIETPNFLKEEKGLSIAGLFRTHEEKTLQKIAEARKKRAEIGDKGTFNPYENLFTTESGNYYMARLLNMPHLEQESAYMSHCVGTSDSYVNRMKRGEIEILSFRQVPKINPKTGKLEGDRPVITIEYNLKTNTIEQMKKANDQYLSPDDPYFNDVIDALKQLRTTRTDAGRLRTFKKINPSELERIKVKDYHVLTENGSIPFREFDPDIHGFVFKVGKLDITPEHSQVDEAKIVSILKGTRYDPEEIAHEKREVTSKTRLYKGELYKGIETDLPLRVEIHPGFPEGRRMERNITIVENKNASDLEVILEKKEVYSTDYAKSILERANLSSAGEYITVVLDARHLMRKTDTKGYLTTDEAKERATELGYLDKDNPTPPEIAAYYALQHGDTIDMYESVWEIGMKPITDSDGYPRVFIVSRDGGGLGLGGRWVNPGNSWYPDGRFLFSVRK